MVECTTQNLLELLSSCENGSVKVGAIVVKTREILEDFRETVVHSFMNEEIKSVESVKQCFNVTGFHEVVVLVFQNNSMIFIYADPSLEGNAMSVICSEEDKWFRKEAIFEAATNLDILDKLQMSAPSVVKRPRKKREKPEEDPVEVWLSSLKIIN